MNRLGTLVLLCLTLSCATAPSAPTPRAATGERTFRKLRGQTLSIRVVDVGALFPRDSGVLAAAKRAITSEFTRAGVTIDENASRRWTLEIGAGTTAEPGSLQQCIRLDGRMEDVAAAYLPLQTSMANRCAGHGLPSVQGDAIGAVWSMGVAAVEAASGTQAKQRAEALFDSLDALLTQLDLQTSNNL